MTTTSTPTTRSGAASPGKSPLTGYLGEQIAAVLDGLTGLREGTDPIHDTRVAIRRTRSTLRVFKKLFDQGAAAAFEAELKWFAGVLGDVRDPQVQRRRLREALADLPQDLVLGPVGSRIDVDIKALETPARQRVSEAMESSRYLDLVTELHRWSGDPPLMRQVSPKRVRSRARKAAAKADSRLNEALADGDDALLHRARKAAKRARYAAELTQWNSHSTKDKRTVQRYKQIQSVLGDLQDTVVARTILRQMGAAAGSTAGENGFTFGLLYAREEQLAQQCRQDAVQLP